MEEQTILSLINGACSFKQMLHTVRMDQDIKDIKESIQDIQTQLRALIAHIKYAPGGEGYDEAKNDFESKIEQSITK